MEPEERLRAAAEQHRREREEAERELVKSTDVATKSYVQSRAKGLTRRRIAEIVGLSYQRVQQIVKRGEVNGPSSLSQ